MSKKFKILLILVLSFCLVLGLVACDTAELTLDKDTLNLTVGDAATGSALLTAKLDGVSANDNKDITWASSNEAVASVSDGTVVALSKGSTTVTAKYKKQTATCEVTVEEDAVWVNPPETDSEFYRAVGYACIPAGPMVGAYQFDFAFEFKDYDSYVGHINFDPNNPADFENIVLEGVYEKADGEYTLTPVAQTATSVWTTTDAGITGDFCALYDLYSGQGTDVYVAQISSAFKNYNAGPLLKDFHVLNSNDVGEAQQTSITSAMGKVNMFLGFNSEDIFNANNTLKVNYSVLCEAMTYLTQAFYAAETPAELQAIDINGIMGDALELAEATFAGNGDGKAVNLKGSNTVKKGADVYTLSFNTTDGTASFKKGETAIFTDVAYALEGRLIKLTADNREVTLFVLFDGSTIDCFGLPLGGGNTVDRTFDNFGRSIL